MTLRLTLDVERLAAHKPSHRWHDDRLARSVPAYLNTGNGRTAVEWPAPLDLAAMLSTPDLDLFRSGARIVARPTGTDDTPEPLPVEAVVEAVLVALDALPHREGASLPYRDLRRAVRVRHKGTTIRSTRLTPYATDVVRALRENLLPAVPARPKARRTATPSRPHAETMREARAVERAAAEAMFDLWLDRFLDPASPPMPARYRLADLHREAVLALIALADEGETLPDGNEIEAEVYRDEERERDVYVPGPRILATVLDRRAPDTRRHTKTGTTYEITEATMPTLFTRAELLAEVGRQERDAMLARYGVTSTTVTETEAVGPARHLRSVG